MPEYLHILKRRGRIAIFGNNISFIDKNSNLNRLYSFHFGYTIDNLKLSPSIHYKQYAKFRQLDVGAYFNLNPINVGIWYRGIPIDSNNYLNSLMDH